MASNVIAIDGPAASGKSTLAKNLAEKLGITYISTGSLYRAIAWKAIRTGTGLKDAAALSKMLDSTYITYAKENPSSAPDIQIDNVFPKEALRTNDVALGASDVATSSSETATLNIKDKPQNSLCNGDATIAQVSSQT